MFLGYRESDPVITICQNNAARTVSVEEVNSVTLELLGFDKTEVEQKPLVQLLPQRIGRLLSEYVEFEDDGNDVGSVLSKVQSFCLVNKHGHELAYRLKVLRSESLDGNAYFKLILQSAQVNRRNEAFRSILRENFKGHEVLDPALGLPDRASIAKDLELTMFYVRKGELNASFAVVELDNHEQVIEKYGPDTTIDMLKHIANVAKQNLRPDDMIGSLPPKRVGILLMDTNRESARMVLNRLRWLVAANPYALPDQTTQPLTVSIGFAPLGAGMNDKNLLEDSEIYMERIHDTTGNALQEVVEVPKRSPGNERRKSFLPFTSGERRKGERRKR